MLSAKQDANEVFLWPAIIDEKQNRSCSDCVQCPHPSVDSLGPKFVLAQRRSHADSQSNARYYRVTQSICSACGISLFLAVQSSSDWRSRPSSLPLDLREYPAFVAVHRNAHLARLVTRIVLTDCPRDMCPSDSTVEPSGDLSLIHI